MLFFGADLTFAISAEQRAIGAHHVFVGTFCGEEAVGGVGNGAEDAAGGYGGVGWGRVLGGGWGGLCRGGQIGWVARQLWGELFEKCNSPDWSGLWILWLLMRVVR